MSRDALVFAHQLRSALDPYLPAAAPAPAGPHVTLTYATSLDSQIAAAPGVQTVLSGPASKAMTHYLRTRHDAILVGCGTAAADDPTLNSRLSDASLASQPRPVVLDPRARWDVSRDRKVVQAAAGARGKGPWVLVDPSCIDSIPASRKAALGSCGGRYIASASFRWPDILALLHRNGITSVMVEGGGRVIDSLLAHHPLLIDSLIVTIAPVYLGPGGVVVSPNAKPRAVHATTNVKWLPLERDVVMCANLQSRA